MLGVICILCYTITNAQFKKGNRMAGANIGAVYFNSGKTDYSYPSPTTGFTRNETNVGVNISPNYGWFINDNTVIGGSVLLSYDHKKYFDEDASNGNTFNKDVTNGFSIGFGGFARNYFSNGGTFLPYGQAGFNFGLSSSKNDGFYFNSSNKYTYSGSSTGGFFANAGLSFGMTKMLNDHTGLDFSLGYSYSYKKIEYKTTTQVDIGNNGTIDQTNINNPTQKYSNHGVVLGIGFQIFLDGKK